MSFKANLKDGDGNENIGNMMKDNKGKINLSMGRNGLRKITS